MSGRAAGTVPQKALFGCRHLILHLDEVETFGGCGGTGGAAVPGGKNGGDVRRGDGSLAYQQESADEVADHVVEESVAANDIEEFVGVALEAGLVDDADVGGAALVVCGGFGFSKAEGAVGIDGGEGREVVFSSDEGGGLLHGVLIERIGVVGDVAGDEGRNDIATPDAVVIALGNGRVAGVESFGHFIHGKDADGGGKTVIEHNAEVGGGDIAGGLESCDLGESVDSGIRTARTLGKECFSGEALDGRGKGALDGGLAGLNLPSVEGRAVIGESEFESAGHGPQGFADCKGGALAWQSQIQVSKSQISAGDAVGCDAALAEGNNPEIETTH